MNRAWVLLGAMLTLGGCGAASEAPPAPPPAAVTTSLVQFRTVREWSDYNGRIQPVETSSVRPRVAGFVTSVRFREGARVGRGQVLFTLDDRPYRAIVERLGAELARAEAEYQLARVNNDRAGRLIDRNALARAELDRTMAEERVAGARMRSAAASLRAAQLDLGFTQVRAPISGRVSRALVTSGNNVAIETELTTIVSDNPVHVYFGADERSFLRYASAQRGEALPVLMGLSTEAGYPHRGRLDFLDNRLDSGSGTIQGRGVFANPSGRFTPGLFARVRLIGGEPYQAALVPDRAVGVDLGRRFVLVLKRDRTTESRTVTLGPIVDGLRLVRSGLRPGDEIVTDGVQRVMPGGPVAPTRRPVPIRSAFLDEISLGPVAAPPAPAASAPAAPPGAAGRSAVARTPAP